jgi:hypothetical protein
MGASSRLESVCTSFSFGQRLANRTVNDAHYLARSRWSEGRELISVHVAVYTETYASDTDHVVELSATSN